MSMNTKEVLEFVKDKTVQQVFVYILIGIFGFFAGTNSVEPCVKEVVCEDIQKDNDLLTSQLSKERLRCQEEKMQAVQIKWLQKTRDLISQSSLLKKLNICLQISRRSKIPRKKMKNFNIYIFGKPPLSFEPSFKLYDLVK